MLCKAYVARQADFKQKAEIEKGRKKAGSHKDIK